MRYPLLVRVAVVTLIACGLLFPLWLIKGKVSERRQRADSVQSAFAAEAGGAQLVAGPFLVLTCEQPGPDGSKVSCPSRVIPPRAAEIEGSLSVEQRYRGIFPVRLFRGELAFSGEFELPQSEGASLWRDAHLTLLVSDPRGLKNASALEAGTMEVRFAPGARGTAVTTGLHATLGKVEAMGPDTVLPFRFRVELTGTSRLEVAPVGDSSRIRLASTWPHPSLVGAFSADAREVSPAGFAANWRINEFATGGAPYWRDYAERGGQASGGPPRTVGVSFIEPVSIYSMSYRAIEYAFLFVLFTFVAFVLVEVMWGVTLHPMQYALVGLALAVFFLLLVALSEHVEFARAYLCAAVACVTLITYYLRHPLRSRPRTSAFAALFSALYASLYFLLQSEDHALLLGSLLVFGALATVMVLTRRLDWNALSRRLAPQAG